MPVRKIKVWRRMNAKFGFCGMLFIVRKLLLIIVQKSFSYPVLKVLKRNLEEKLWNRFNPKHFLTLKYFKYKEILMMRSHSINLSILFFSYAFSLIAWSQSFLSMFSYLSNPSKYLKKQSEHIRPNISGKSFSWAGFSFCWYFGLRYGFSLGYW